MKCSHSGSATSKMAIRTKSNRRRFDGATGSMYYPLYKAHECKFLSTFNYRDLAGNSTLHPPQENSGLSPIIPVHHEMPCTRRSCASNCLRELGPLRTSSTASGLRVLG